MALIKLPVGRSSFADIRRNGYYYVDKSGLIRELLKAEGTQVTLITRPRRFGKTLGINMLAEFFDIQKDSRDLFQGLSVAGDSELCQHWMNQYPTLFFSLKTVDGLDFCSAYAQLSALLAELYKHHFYLMDSSRIHELDKQLFYKIAAQNANLVELKNSLSSIIKMLYCHYQKPVILLMDEYDVPLAKASEKGYYEQMLDVMKGIMYAIKDNEYLKLAVITGCLRMAKESIFTGTNNFISDTITGSRLNEYFGFTQTEVEKLLADTSLSAHSKEIKEWYDGYHFGDYDVYCPWDVINHVSRLLLHPNAKPSNYWGNTSDNAVIRSFIDLTGSSITKKFETLLSGGTVVQKLEDELTYDNLHSSEENLWSILYLTGYLTTAKDTPASRQLPQDCLAFVIPNAEIRSIFEKTVQKWFAEQSKAWNREKLFAAVWSGDAQTVTSEMGKLLRRTISYHDYKEDFYHAFFAGIFAGAGYAVESNQEYGEGRSDIVVLDDANDRAAVFEIKYAKTPAALETACARAVRQIDERAYAKTLEEDFAHVVCYGIAFYKKRCAAKVKKGGATE